MKISLLALSAATLALAGTTAIAGGLNATVVEPAVVPAAIVPVATIVPSDWSGFYAGGAVGTGSGDITDTDSGDVFAESDDLTSYGIYAGYNYDFGAYVLGGEASYDMIDIDQAPDEDVYVARIGARAGYDAGAFLPYVSAGFAMLSIDNGTGSDDTGYYYGAGVDYRVTDSIVVGAQYLRHEFEDFDGQGFDYQADLAQIRVAYQF